MNIENFQKEGSGYVCHNRDGDEEVYYRCVSLKENGKQSNFEKCELDGGGKLKVKYAVDIEGPVVFEFKHDLQNDAEKSQVFAPDEQVYLLVLVKKCLFKQIWEINFQLPANYIIDGSHITYKDFPFYGSLSDTYIIREDPGNIMDHLKMDPYLAAMCILTTNIGNKGKRLKHPQSNEIPKKA